MTTTAELIAAIRVALVSLDVDDMSPLLADDVIWDGCIGRAAVLEEVQAARNGGLAAKSADITEFGDRLVVDIELADDAGTFHLALFTEDDLIVEIRAFGIETHDDAVRIARTVKPAQPSGATSFDSMAVVFPVRDTAAAMEHYRRLGFHVHSYDGGDFYAFAERGEVQVHLSRVEGLDPLDNASAAYIYVGDADALYAEWINAGIEGRLTEPESTDYGLREGAHIDPDGNLIRFGSPIG